MRVHFLSLFVVHLFLCSCGNRDSGQSPAPLTVAVAASMQGAVEEIAAQFTSETGIPVVISSAATGVLYRQAKEGAPFDLFISADAEHLQKLQDERMLASGTLSPFALGRLVLWQREDAAPVLSSLEDLNLAEWAEARIGIASPDNAPYGAAAMQVLDGIGFSDQRRANLIIGTNVSQVYQFASTGNVSAAFISASLVPENQGRSLAISVDLYDSITHDMAILSRTMHPEAAKQFHIFLLSEKASAILIRRGFQLPAREAV